MINCFTVKRNIFNSVSVFSSTGLSIRKINKAPPLPWGTVHIFTVVVLIKPTKKILKQGGVCEVAFPSNPPK
jgi:hypothetical protein